MKSLMVYINPSKSFKKESYNDWGDETEVLARVQVDNHLRMGWKREDILLVTNFEYEYNGVKSIVVGDEVFCDYSPTSSKLKGIVELFNLGLIKNELYWFHDWDVFQMEPITEDELEMGDKDVALTEYGITTINEWRNHRPSTGTIFFKNTAKDVFELILWETGRYKCNEEVALLELRKKNKNNITSRIKYLDVRYNFATRKRDVLKNYNFATKPIKMIHFHPFDKRRVDKVGEKYYDNMEVCVYGKSRIGRPLVTQGLIDVFKKHGIS